MKLTYTIDDVHWHALIHNVAQNFDDLTIKRGFQYFKQGHVHELTMPDAEHIEAVVTGSEQYSVDLNLDSFARNHCSCPVPANCKHMIAVLLEYAKLQERSVHALVNAHSAAVFKQVVKPPSQSMFNRPAFPIIDRKAEASAKLKGQANQISTLPMSEWHHLFEQCIGPIGMKIPNTQYAQNSLASIYAIQPQLSPVMDLLYQFHAHLFVLTKLVTPPQHQVNYANYYMGFHTQVAADDIRDAIGLIVSNKLALQAEPEQWDHVIETSTLIRTQMLTEPQNLQYFLHIYNQLWLKWIHPNVDDKKIYLKELDYLQSAQVELGDSLSKLPWMLAKSWMQFYLSQDEQAWALLQELEKTFNIYPEDLYSFLTILRIDEDWPRMQHWLVELSPLLSNHRNNNLSYYWACWESTIVHLPEAEPMMWSMLSSMLPQSKHIYEDKLLAHGKWEPWMDYQLSIEAEPLDYRVTVFQPIEKNAPELLLPFYHQAVERYIVQKNRASYKQAVKLLKRLAKLYKKTKQEARWELFITVLANRHSRLRALQEELRRGKLIP